MSHIDRASLGQWNTSSTFVKKKNIQVDSVKPDAYRLFLSQRRHYIAIKWIVKNQCLVKLGCKDCWDFVRT